MLKIFSWPFAVLGFPVKIISLIYKILFAALVIFAVVAYSSPAEAACVGAKHVYLTGGSTEECVERKRVKQEAKRDKEEDSRYRKGDSSFMSEARAWNNTLTGKKQDYVARIGVDKLHALQINWGLYFLPTEAGYSKQGPSHFTPSALTYYYYINPSFSVGMKYQAYTLYASPFEGNQGSDTLDVMRVWGHGTFHFDISEGTQFYTQVGVPMMDSSKVYLNGEAKGDPVGSNQFMFELGLSYAIGSNKVDAGARFIDAPNGSTDMATYHNLGATELFVGITIGVM